MPVLPHAADHEPHVMALYMRTAMYAKLASELQGNRSTLAKLNRDCDVVIQTSLQYFDLMYLPTEGQEVLMGGVNGTIPMQPRDVNPFVTPPKTPNTPNGSVYYGFWAGEIMEAMAVYLLHHATFRVSSDAFLLPSLQSAQKQLGLGVRPSGSSVEVQLGITMETKPGTGAEVLVHASGRGLQFLTPLPLRFNGTNWNVETSILFKWDGTTNFSSNETLSLTLGASSTATGVFLHEEVFRVIDTAAPTVAPTTKNDTVAPTTINDTAASTTINVVKTFGVSIWAWISLAGAWTAAWSHAIITRDCIIMYTDGNRFLIIVQRAMINARPTRILIIFRAGIVTLVLCNAAYYCWKRAWSKKKEFEDIRGKKARDLSLEMVKLDRSTSRHRTASCGARPGEWTIRLCKTVALAGSQG